MTSRNLAILILVCAIPGCGGSGSAQTSTSRASVRIEWPGTGRLIPAASNYIRVRAWTLDGQPVGTTPPAVQRPATGVNQTSEIIIDQLPVGQTVTIRAEAFPDAGLDSGGKKAQARGDTMLLIRNDAPNTFDISMASTVRSLTVNLIQNGQTVQPPYLFEAGDLIIAAVQSRDTEGDTVLVTSSNLQWTRSGGAGVLMNGD